MALSPRFPGQRLPDSVRNRLEIASAMAWEAIVGSHATQALAFVYLLEDRMPLEESLTRFLIEVDIGDATADAVRNRTLIAVGLESDPTSEQGPEVDPGAPTWDFSRLSALLSEYGARQRRDDETERWIQLALARAEEAAIITHIDNATTFVALLEGVLPIHRSVTEYMDAVGLAGSRARTVFQRTMARMADIHLPPVRED